MKTRLMAALAALAVPAAAFASAAPMSALERQRIAAHMEMTTGWLEGEVAGLSRTQLEFRPADGAWNILEIVDHLAVAEPIYWRDYERAMKSPPAGPKPNPLDDGVLWYGIDRTQRQKAIPAELPKGQLPDARAGLNALRKLHEEMLRYVKTTGDDPRAHMVEREGCDAYQWLLLISSHRQRHVLQIREVKADRRFPKR